MRGLEGRTAVVTGAASGIGRAIAMRLAEEGVRTVIFDIDEAGAKATADAAGGNVSAQHCDITDLSSVQEAVEATEKDVAPIDFLVNNAGWDLPTSFLDSDPDFWAKVIGINLMGPIHMHHTVLNRMAERGAGRVVNIASDAGRVGSSGEAVYSACKGGVIAFTKTLAREVSRRNITLNTVSGPDRHAPVRCVQGCIRRRRQDRGRAGARHPDAKAGRTCRLSRHRRLPAER